MNTAEQRITQTRQTRAIRFNLTFPVTRLGFGMFQLDPVTQALGAPLTEILSSLMVAPVRQRPSAAGPAVDVYVLALPEGEGALLNLAQLGQVGFANREGWLVLTVPVPFASWVQQRLAHVIAHGPEISLSTDGMSRVADFWIHLVPGMRSALPLGILGEVGIETA